MHTSRSRWIVGPLVVGPPVNGEDVLHLSNEHLGNEHLGNEPSALLGWDPPLAMPVRLESVVDLSVVDLSVVDLSVWSVWRTVS
jgi:hypothetical protein